MSRIGGGRGRHEHDFSFDTLIFCCCCSYSNLGGVRTIKNEKLNITFVHYEQSQSSAMTLWFARVRISSQRKQDLKNIWNYNWHRSPSVLVINYYFSKNRIGVCYQSQRNLKKNMAVSILLNPRLRDIYATKRVHCVWKCFDDVALSEEKENGGDADEEEKKKMQSRKCLCPLAHLHIGRGPSRHESTRPPGSPFDRLSFLSLWSFLSLALISHGHRNVGPKAPGANWIAQEGKNKSNRWNTQQSVAILFKSSKLV